MEFNFSQRAGEVVEITDKKWEARKKNQLPNAPRKTKDKIEKSYYPRELQELLNIKTALCPHCRTPCSSEHLLFAHQIQIPENTELINLMKAETNSKIKEGKKKLQILEELGTLLTPLINKVQMILTTPVSDQDELDDLQSY